MKKKIFAVLAVTLLVLSTFSAGYIKVANGAEEFPDYEAVDWQSGLAGKVEMPTVEESIGEYYQTVESLASTPPVGTVVWDWYLWALSRNDPGGAGQKAWMTLKNVSGNVEVWVQNDMSFPINDPRNAYPRNWTVTDDMITYIANVFNSIIYPTDITYFGMPYDRDGSGNYFINRMYPPPPATPESPPNWWYWIETPGYPQRVILKILNCRDSNYYNPLYPSYTAGFYNSLYTKTYYKRNMIHIDCWQWWRRVGPAGYKWYPDTAVDPTRANQYESVVAHEFQHNIHRDWNTDDETFMNEGCSEYAQVLCGWPNTLWSHINNYLYTPDNSLTVWGDQGDINILADYGAAALWAMYLSDQYGGAATISHFVKAGIPGIAGVDATLAYFGYNETFDDVYHDWRIANLIHSNLVADSRYNYKTLDLGSPAAIQAFRHTISGIPVPWTRGTTAFGTTWAYNGYDTGVATIGSYGSDYIVLNNWDKMGVIYFDGDDYAIYGWALTADGWYSGGLGRTVNLINDLIYSEAYVDPANPTLEIVTKYDIEYLWDFGFIQVSTDGGAHWTSQSNAYTTMDHDPGALPAIVANLPGLTGKNPGYPAWLTMTFDLTAYAGQTVRIGFRYMTDSASLGQGWWINSAKVSGADLTLTTGKAPLEALFQVSLIRVYVQDGVIVKYLVADTLTEEPSEGVNIQSPNYCILVVSAISRKGFFDYQFRVRVPPIRINS